MGITGEVLGVIGSNGAGKTTTLKLLSKVTQPTTGKIVTRGRISSLIELGAGFHPDLTGRENIYLNGTIMGLSKSEISKKYNQIVAFAELEPFLETPVKRYSSGMYARLGFAVAAHVDPDVLLVDEVLAVGDEAFQIKCRDFMRSYIKNGHTVVFVSHNLYAIEQLSDRVIWLKKGRIAQMGAPSAVLRTYLDEIDAQLIEIKSSTDHQLAEPIKIQNLEIINGTGIHTNILESGDDMTIEINYSAANQIERPYFCIWISEAQSSIPIFAANMLLDNFKFPYIEGQGKIACHFNNIPLMPKAYNVWVEIYGKDRSELLYKWRILGSFRILDPDTTKETQENIRGQVRFSRSHATIKVPYEWYLD